MQHPIFDNRRFPRARKDARDFLRMLKQVVGDPRAILALYESSGGDFLKVNFRQEPEYIWDDAIRVLAANGQIRTLCDRILENDGYAKLHEAANEIIAAGSSTVAQGPPPSPNDKAKLNNFLRTCIGRAAKLRGMTVLVSPYASFDAYELDDPRQLGEQVFMRSFERRLQEYLSELGQDKSDFEAPDFTNDILSNLLVATSGSYAISADYDDVWSRMCEVPMAEDDPLDLHEQLTSFASTTTDCFEHNVGSVDWNGLLLISFDVTSRLERALAAAGIDFGLLRLLKDGTVAHNKHVGNLRFSDVTILPQSSKAGPFRPVMLLKLLGARYLKGDQQRPVLGLEVLSRIRQIGAMPRLLQIHLQKKPFVMLGGGLIDPFAALCYGTLIRPAFSQCMDQESQNSRWVALHPQARSGSVVRQVESIIDRLNPDWTKVYDLNRLVHDFPDLVARMSTRLAECSRDGGQDQ